VRKGGAYCPGGKGKKLWRQTDQEPEPVLTQLRRKWNWLGHILERNDDSIAKQALLGNSMATEIDDRIRGKRDVEKEMWTAGFRYSWRKMEVAAQDRTRWRQVICGL